MAQRELTSVHLPCGRESPDGRVGNAVDVVCVLQEELLRVEALVVLDADGGSVVDHLVLVQVKEVGSGVEQPDWS